MLNRTSVWSLGAGLLAGAVMRSGRRAFAPTYTLLSPRVPICLNKVTQTKLILDPMVGTVDSKSK